jgi:hypothetical protein
VWYEPDGSRRQCQSVSQQGLGARLERVTERLVAGAPNMLRSGSELIGYYLSYDRRLTERAWSRRHAATRRDLCARYLEPVIGHLASQDITVTDMQAAMNAAPTAKKGKRVRAVISALRRWHQRRVPGQRQAQERALAGAGPPSARAAGGSCGGDRAVRGCRRDADCRRCRQAWPGGRRQLAVRKVTVKSRVKHLFTKTGVVTDLGHHVRLPVPGGRLRPEAASPPRQRG